MELLKCDQTYPFSGSEKLEDIIEIKDQPDVSELCPHSHARQENGTYARKAKQAGNFDDVMIFERSSILKPKNELAKTTKLPTIEKREAARLKEEELHSRYSEGKQSDATQINILTDQPLNGQ